MRCLCLIGCLLGALLAGCSSPYEPHETVTVKLSGVSSERQQERIEDKLKGMTEGSSSWMSTTRWGESITINLAPVTDVQAFAEQIDFGKVTDVSGRTVTVNADAPPSSGNRATQTSPDSRVPGVPSAKERERVEHEVNDATGIRLDLDWLQSLDAATAEKLLPWGSGESSNRSLSLNGLQTLDPATAEKLAQWGSGAAGSRFLFLDGVQTLDATTAEKLAQWGSGDAGERSLFLNGLQTLEPATAEKLAHWGSGESGERSLHLNSVQTLDAAIAEKLAQWGSGESGGRTLALRGVQTLDAEIAEKLAQWGSGDAGERGLGLIGVQTLDAEIAEKLAQWGSGDAGGRGLSLIGVRKLDAEIAEKLAQWGSGDAGGRGLSLIGVRKLDAEIAEKLAQWGSGDAAERTLALSGVQTMFQAMDAATAEKLAQWGSGDAGERSLFLNGLQTLDPATAEKLAQWGSGDAGERSLHLNSVQTLDAEIAEKLAQWGSDGSGERSLHLNSVQTLDAEIAEKLTQWGSGDAGSRSLSLYGVRTLDAATAEKLAQWESRESPFRVLYLHNSAKRAVRAQPARPAPEQAQPDPEGQLAIAEMQKRGGKVTEGETNEELAVRRQWTDSTGEFQLTAELVKVENDLVHLRRNDGRVVEVPVDRLSAADQNYLRSIGYPRLGWDVREQAEPTADVSRSEPSPPSNLPPGSPPPAIAPFDAVQAREHQEAWAKHLGVPVKFENSIGMTLVYIPAGEFLMGSPDSDGDALSHEKPQHLVRITRPFYLGVYPVTQGEYEAVMGSHPSNFTGDPRLPVERVSWNDAVEFCKRLSGLPEEQASGRVYRLPTEAEWEYACRAGTGTVYSFGDSVKLLGDYGWYHWNSGRKTHPVGQLKPNAWGLYDMHGNVQEWCADWKGVVYYASSAVDDPTGPPSGSRRVFRGGGGGSPARYCRSAHRSWSTPESRDDFLGFRVARSPSGR